MLNTGATQDLETFLVTSWSIWYNRNQKVFEDDDLSLDQVWFFAVATRFDYREATALCNKNQTSDAGRWEAPPSGMCKVNVDRVVSRDGRLPSVEVIFESNALTDVQDLQAKETNGSSGHLYQGIVTLLESFCSWKVCHLKRKYNKSAHALAQFAKCNGTNQVWKGCVPWMVQHIIESDCS
ncbi:uncharacterized protein LOC115990137 [Quercus lobata]|uniref:uncharacterized protein LOC115990137 n=1 Tax=Quercus lobata TaxID=97700 RepID=UPI001247C478|nr:uncharacterized protein LOC115990137 [Quercus lobata]